MSERKVSGKNNGAGLSVLDWKSRRTSSYSPQIAVFAQYECNFRFLEKYIPIQLTESLGKWDDIVDGELVASIAIAAHHG